MPESLTPEERLIVAADYKPKEHGGIDGVRGKVLDLAVALEEMGVVIKVNSILRAVGYSLITELHDMGLKVFADLKLVEIPNTVETDGQMLAEVKPELVTVMCNADIEAMSRLKREIGNESRVLGVTVLTSLDFERCQEIYGCTPEEGVRLFARIALYAGLKGLVLSPKEIEVAKEVVPDFDLITPGIRPLWAVVEGDDQARVMTPGKAILAGSSRLVVGRPITQAKNPREAVQRTIDEIANALAGGE
jgi:orotidine-5'-phosphate decarboxylase